MLEIDKLHKVYGEVVALDGCSFRVQRGQLLGFLGPNGAGKTTTMRSVFSLVQPDSGAVRWRGAVITPRTRLRFGYMPEQRGLYPRMRVASQLVYFARLHGMDKHAADAATSYWLDRLGLSNRAESRLEELSHGNQQRIQLAAALLHDPELLVLDEPFSGLDPVNARLVKELIAERRGEGRLILLSTRQQSSQTMRSSTLKTVAFGSA